MKIAVKKVLQIAIPIGIGVFFIWYSFYKTSEEERELLWKSIKTAKPLWIILSAFLGVLAHISRSYRWLFLANTLGYKPRLSTSYMALMMGYLANLGIPRSGEILRASTLSNYEDVPFQKTIGTVISERIVDLIMLLLVVLIGVATNTTLFLNYFENENINPLFIFLGIILFIILLYFCYLVVKKSDIKMLKKVRKFILEIYEGILSVLKMKNRVSFIFHTFFIWSAYIFMFYIMKFAIPELNHLSFSAALAAFIVGSFAMTVSNGGFGVFPIAIGAILIFFNVEQSIGEAYGWVLWGAQTITNIIIGGFSFILLPFFLKKK